MKPFALARPATLAEARRLAREATPLAGGTDLLGLMKAGVAAPPRLVDLTGVGALRGLRRERGRGLRIGALVRLAELEEAKDAPQVLREAASLAATPQLRATGTVGGNLLQRNRCWYFRDEAFPCWLKGGARCFARHGENRYHSILGVEACVAAAPSDLAPALIALDARAALVGPRASRTVAVADLYQAPREGVRDEHTLRPAEIVTEVRVPEASLARRGVYLKQMERKTWAFALVSVAAAARVHGGQVTDVRLVLGGVAPLPWRAREAERVAEGTALDERVAAAAGEAAVAGAQPLEHNAYKIVLARELVRRALLRLVT